MRRLAVPFFAAVLVAVTMLGVAPSARAASPKLSLADPAGDALDQRPSMDITNLSFEVKKVKPTDPKHSVVISLKLAAAPEQRLVSYDVTAQIPGCGSFHVSYAPNTVLNTLPDPSSPASVYVCNGQTGAADGLELFSPKFSISKDNTMTWTIALDSFPRAAREGGAFTAIQAETQIADPVFGLEGNGQLLPTDELRAELEKEFTFV